MVTPEAFAGALWVELRAFFGQQELRFRTSEAMAVSVGGTRAYQGLSGLPDIVARAVERARRMEFEFSCLPEQGKLLSVLAAGRSGGVIGETGTGYGVGLAWIVSAVSPATRVVSVERERERAEAAQALFRDYPNVTVVHGDWQELERYGPFDLLVIDGGGSGKKGEAPFDPVKWLTPTGAFVIDDFTPMEAWPPQHDGGVDSIRLYWLKHPELLTTEIRTSSTALSSATGGRGGRNSAAMRRRRRRSDAGEVGILSLKTSAEPWTGSRMGGWEDGRWRVVTAAVLPITGGCYCGAIRYRIDQLPVGSEICYCSNCRRAIGSHVTSWLRVKSESFTLVQGEPRRYRTDTNAWRTFCGTCGTSLTYQSDWHDREGLLDVTIASLDRPELFPPASVSYEDERIPWDS